MATKKKTKQNSQFTFIDLFAGIGGIRIAFEVVGGKCVFSSEYDPHAQKTYEAFFGERPDFAKIKEVDPPGDITKLPDELLDDLVPDHDILTAGFPCQPFSLAGVSKKQSLGRPHGFDDPTQGTLFYNIKEIIKSKRPKAFLLENVKNLQSHDNKRTYPIIKNTLESLYYYVDEHVINAKGWVPQNRERIFIAGFRKDLGIESFDELKKIKPPSRGKDLVEILEKEVPEKYTLGPGTWATLERHKANHKARGQGFGYGLISPPFKGKTTRTLSARYHKDGAEILIHQKGKRPRRLTPLECAKLMGFTKKYYRFFERNGKDIQPVSDTQAYRQFGNSVVVPKVTAVALEIVKKLQSAGAL